MYSNQDKTLASLNQFNAIEVLKELEISAVGNSQDTLERVKLGLNLTMLKNQSAIEYGIEIIRSEFTKDSSQVREYFKNQLRDSDQEKISKILLVLAEVDFESFYKDIFKLINWNVPIKLSDIITMHISNDKVRKVLIDQLKISYKYHETAHFWRRVLRSAIRFEDVAEVVLDLASNSKPHFYEGEKILEMAIQFPAVSRYFVNKLKNCRTDSLNLNNLVELVLTVKPSLESSEALAMHIGSCEMKTSWIPEILGQMEDYLDSKLIQLALVKITTAACWKQESYCQFRYMYIFDDNLRKQAIALIDKASSDSLIHKTFVECLANSSLQVDSFITSNLAERPMQRALIQGLLSSSKTVARKSANYLNSIKSDSFVRSELLKIANIVDESGSKAALKILFNEYFAENTENEPKVNDLDYRPVERTRDSVSWD